VADTAANLVAAAEADLDWIRTKWTFAQWVDPRPANTAVAGHSFGALTAAAIAAAHPEYAAMASLSGGYGELPDPSNAAHIYPPSLFMWARNLGDEDLDQNGLWSHIPQWKYAAPFDGSHFDYLDRVDSAPALRGPCPYIPELAAALVALFIAENLPTPLGTTHVGIDLQRPQVQLTPQQQSYASGHLNGLNEIAGDTRCTLTLRWDYNAQQGSRTLN
jgi:pimeloyl-ACP methyl ester carboxylesterase